MITLYTEKCEKLIEYAYNSLIMHDPHTILFGQLPLIITKISAKFRPQQASTCTEQVQKSDKNSLIMHVTH